MNSIDKFKQAIQGMGMNFGQTVKKVANILPPVQAYNAVRQIAPKAQQYFNPTSNQGNNFWSSKPAQGFANIQRNIQITAPKIQQLGQRIVEKTTPDFNIRTPQQLGQAITRAPFQFAGQFVGGTLQDLGQVAGMAANPEKLKSLPNITAKSFFDPSNPSKASVGLSAFSLLPVGASVKSIQADAKAFKTMLPEIRAVGNMLGKMDDIPSLSPRQVEAAEEIVAKIRGTEFVKKILKTSKNPADYYNNIRRTLAYAEDIVNNPQAAFGLSTKAVDTSKFRQSTKGVESMPVKKVDPFEAEMDARTQELTNAAKLPKIEKPFVDTTKQATDIGDIKSNIGEKGGVVDSIKESFARWVNARKATQVEGVLQGKSFEDLRQKGMEGIFEFQGGNKTGRYADVKNYFDTKYGQMQEKGIEFNYKDDYLTQIWDNTTEEVDRVFGKSLSKNPSFTLESLIKNYREGIEAGLKPKYQSIPDLIRSYEQSTNKAIADHDFFRTLIKENMITTGSKAPRDWVTIDPDHFPRFSVKTDEGNYKGIYKAPPELAKMLNNYLGGAKFEWLARAADWTSSVKNRVLSFGIPGTAINAHGVNILSRNIMSSKNPIEGAITGIKYMLNPMSAQRYLDANLSKAPDAIKKGLTLSANEFKNVLEAPDTLRGKGAEIWNKLFERGLFDRMLPSLKLQKYEEVYQGFRKSGMSDQEAGREAAKFTNGVFGGINWEELGKSADMQNLLRVTILAPDWLKTNLGLAKNLPKSVIRVTDPKMAPYRKFLATFIGSYITANVVNKLSSGHWMYQNDPGNSFNIEAGYTEDGQKRYIRPYGTAADFVRLPSDILTALAKGDVSVIGRLVRNRLSIPLGVVIGAMTDTDYAGQPIGYRGKNKYGQEIPTKQRIMGIGAEAATLLGMPSFAKQGIDYLSGKTGGEQALLQAFELPVRYTGGAYTKTQKDVRGVAQKEGKAGKELYDINQIVKTGGTIGKNEMELLKQGGTQNLAEVTKKAPPIEDEPVKEGNFYYYKDGDQTKKIDLSFPMPEYKPTGNATLDKELLSDYKGAITKRKNEVMKAWEVGAIDQGEAIKQLESLVTASNKTKKAKKPKKITVKAVSVPKRKISNIKITIPKGVKVANPPSLKRYKPKNIRIAVGKSKVQAIKFKPFKNTLTEGFTKLA